jgi:CubicO group peptidase (beta-lactamase class C family)
MNESIFLPNAKRLDELQSQLAQVKIDYFTMTVSHQVVMTYARSPKSANKLHKINSVTKSVLSLLIGIALDRKQLESIHVPLTEFFPGLHNLEQELTLEHLLTMTAGWDWPEWADWNGFPKPMYDSPDWVKFILSRPLTEKPGTRMVYNSGCSHLLSAILQKVSGMTTAAYAEKYLFKPMGLADFRWRSDANGIDIGGFGLELKASDLHKLGTLMLGKGQLGNVEIVSKAWVDRSVQSRFMSYPHVGAYGYHWWVMSDSDGRTTVPYTYFAMGFGGQFVFVVPERKWVVSFASSLYKQSFLPYQLFKSLFD